MLPGQGYRTAWRGDNRGIWNSGGTVIGEGKPQVLGNKPSPTSFPLPGISRCHSELNPTLRRADHSKQTVLSFLILSNKLSREHLIEYYFSTAIPSDIRHF